MRPGATILGGSSPAPAATRTGSGAYHSSWHSPVPYLFGGLAAMLGLIAFALLILACSYWRLSGLLDGGDGEETGKEGGAGEEPPSPAYKEGIVVIMAGDEKPTFLATPISSRASSFGERNQNASVSAGAGRDGEGSCDGECDGKKTDTGIVRQPNLGPDTGTG
ncbi:Protein glutamine dumper 3 [Apostasia shenzhenica]|uniref:Protein glutamine dumper 3 n=1 Tax=Apostasia shenzhenica TaxID=1088818 RepID=A0A2I0A1M2_9ASPA|nr:Protein glutamine dumper 3 [Apostasia shenzhenica]